MLLNSEESVGKHRWRRSYQLEGGFNLYAQAVCKAKPEQTPDPDREWIVWIGGESPYEHNRMRLLRETPGLPPQCRWIRFRPHEEEYISTTESTFEELGSFVASALEKT